jgi:hypothetical protein
MPLPYCTAADIRRKLDESGSLRADEQARYNRRARAASSEWDSTTGTPLRTVRIGAPEAPQTWEHHDARGLSNRPPVTVSLNHDNIVPINGGAGDTIEIRTGRDTWEDVTSEYGDEWVLDNQRGQLKLYRFLFTRLFFEAPSERFVRLTYRAGGLGGGPRKGVTTALASAADSSTTTLTLTNAARLTDPPLLAALGSDADFEYVTVTDIDYAADEVTVVRGQERTDAQAHDSGDALQYVPEAVREAVAAKAAAMLTRDDDARTSVPDEGQLTSRNDRASALEAEWQDSVKQYRSVSTL